MHEKTDYFLEVVYPPIEVGETRLSSQPESNYAAFYRFLALQKKIQYSQSEKPQMREVSSVSLLSQIGDTSESEVLDQAKKEIMASPQDAALFKEFFYQDFWTARVNFNQSEEEGFKEALDVCAKTLGEEEFEYSGIDYIYYGFFTSSRDNPAERQYNFTNYPEIGEQVMTIDYCWHILQHLVHNLGNREINNTASVIAGKYKDKHGKNARIVLGLQEGMVSENTQNNGTLHAFEEVGEALKLLGEDVEIIPTEIYSVGPAMRYREPGVVIYAKGSTIPYIYLLAYAFKQERFTVEHFSEGNAYTVELARSANATNH